MSECVEWAHRKVNQIICALANRSDHTTHARFLVVHVATDDQLVDILANILRMRERIIRDIAGLYVPEYRMVLVSGDANSIQLREHVVHEFSHAICHSTFGATGCIPWASEGLAGFVCDKLLQ